MVFPWVSPIFPQVTSAEAAAAELRNKLQGQEAQVVRSQAEMAKAQRGEKELKEEMEAKHLGFTGRFAGIKWDILWYIYIYDIYIYIL